MDGTGVPSCDPNRGIMTLVRVLILLLQYMGCYQGLNGGGYDFLCKPFDMNELDFIRALLRRPESRWASDCDGNITFDMLERDIWRHEVRVNLTRREEARSNC